MFIHVGGNDILITSETANKFLPIKALVQELWRSNVVVMVGEAYKPTYVFIHMGGNDISRTSETDDIFLPIKAFMQELWRRNVVEMVGEGMPRLSYRDPTLMFDIYEKKLKRVNDKLRSFLKKNYRPIFVQGLFNGRPHRDLDEDLVHLSDFGQ